jgi:hypothetical protein
MMRKGQVKGIKQGESNKGTVSLKPDLSKQSSESVPKTRDGYSSFVTPLFLRHSLTLRQGQGVKQRNFNSFRSAC